MLKKLFSHTAIYGLAPQVSKLAGLLALPVITKHLTQTDFGVFGVITAVVGGLSIFANLGLNVVLSNSFYKSPLQYKWAWRQIYGFLILWNLPYAVMLGMVIYVFVPLEAQKDTLYIVTLNTISIVFFGPTAIIGSLYYQLKQKPAQVAIRSAIVGTLTVGLNVYFIAYKGLGYMGWFLSSCVSQMLLQVSYWLPIYFTLKLKPIFNFKRRFIKRQLLVSLPAVPHYYGAYLLNTSDRLIMKILKIPIGDIGLYNAANIVGNMVEMVSIASGQAISPVLLATYKNENEPLARNLIFILQTAFLTGTFLCSIWLKEIFFLLIQNHTLRRVYPLGIIIIMAYNYRPMYIAANNRLFYYEKTKVLPKITFVAGMGNVVLNIALIPFFGYQVAVYTTFIWLMYMGYIGFYLKEFKERCSLSYYPLRWLLLTVLLTYIAYYVVDFLLWRKILITLSVVLIGFIYLYKLNKRNSND